MSGENAGTGVETGQLIQADRASVSARGTDKIVSCDGRGLKGAFWAASQWLKRHIAVVNALNVFPVPDGDTGTNMSLTMAAAMAEVERTSDTSISTVARAVAQGALMGARGNSGVILSQILRGFAHGLDGKETLSAQDVTAAIQEAYATALRGVIRPVDGTILTVMRDVALAAREAATRSDDLLAIFSALVETAKESTAHTPELLAVLKEAGVVDAGAQGLVYLLEGVVRYMQGESVELDAEVTQSVELKSDLAPGQAGYGYDVQFLIRGEHLNVEEIRQAIDAMGESALVVGDSHMLKVHVHVHDPSLPISYGHRQGSLSDITIENMQEQYQRFVLDPLKTAGAGSSEDVTDVAIVSVAPGEGLSRIFRSMHPATVIVHGGQTMNPSIQELLTAINGATKDKVLVLPNNGNVIPAAQQACALSTKDAYVVPTRSIPQGIGALMAFNYQAGLQENIQHMQESMGAIRTIEMTRAVRSTQVNSLQVAEGNVIGLLDDKLVSAGSDYTQVALEVLAKAMTPQHEIVTIYYGQDATRQEAEALADQIRSSYPQLETEIQYGGQPHYRYILSLE